MTGWADSFATLKEGDCFTCLGDYQRRTFWQWLTRQPRILKQWSVTDVVYADLNRAVEGLWRDFEKRPDLMMQIGEPITMDVWPRSREVEKPKNLGRKQTEILRMRCKKCKNLLVLAPNHSGFGEYVRVSSTECWCDEAIVEIEVHDPKWSAKVSG